MSIIDEALEGATPATRLRLPAHLRVAQILDAALQVFSDKGYAASRIEDIGAVAQLSKGGIYTHFRSKEEIFEALLMRLLPPLGPPAALEREARVTVDVLVERVVLPMYASFGDASNLTTLRLLLADGRHAPQMVERWRQAVVEPFLTEVESLIRRGVRQGALRRSVLMRAPRLALSPGMHAMLDGCLTGRPDAAAIAEQQRLHISLLRELLEP